MLDSAVLSGLRLNEIQQQLGEAVNALVKYFYANAEARSRGELTQLLCAPGKGFVSVMVAVFMYGRQDSICNGKMQRRMRERRAVRIETCEEAELKMRLSKYRMEIRVIEKVCKWFWDLMHMEDSKRLTREQRLLIMQAYRLCAAVAFATNSFSFLRDHILSGLLPLMAWTPITSQMYDQPSFLRTPHYLNYLSKLISSLNEFQFTLEKSLTYGVE
ncbi:unnamed protein product [Gongylonema pulchrum]|uniref:Ufd2P_core domain-containing protein n=1 Tax=Gongylonema pulchrum TaxID=637853 RepID=A0A183DR39_9BILA|nr:unnamed protein product [Gongylonema pulchrum]